MIHSICSLTVLHCWLVLLPLSSHAGDPTTSILTGQCFLHSFCFKSSGLTAKFTLFSVHFFLCCFLDCELLLFLTGPVLFCAIVC